MAIQTGLTEEKVSRHADAYVKLSEKQGEFSQKMGRGQELEVQSETSQTFSRLKKLLAFAEKQGGFKAQNCKHAGKDRYCRFWKWPTEPVELSRNPKKDDEGSFHIQATPIIARPVPPSWTERQRSRHRARPSIRADEEIPGARAPKSNA